MLVHSPTVVDYSNLLEAGKGKIKVPCDIDGTYERYGNFLHLECKHEDNMDVSDGQRSLLEKLARQPNTIVLLVLLTGERTSVGSLVFNPIAYTRIGMRNPSWKQTNLSEFIVLLQAWENFAKSRPGKCKFVDWKPLPSCDLSH